MSGDRNAGTGEPALAGIDSILDRLTHELTCLVDLGALEPDAEAALSAFLRDLRELRESIASGDDEERLELENLTKALAADLDLAYMRLAA